MCKSYYDLRQEKTGIFRGRQLKLGDRLDHFSEKQCKIDDIQMVDFIQIDRVISNKFLVTAMEPSLLRPEVVVGATRDGKVKIINVNTGQIEKVYCVNENSII